MSDILKNFRFEWFDKMIEHYIQCFENELQLNNALAGSDYADLRKNLN